MNHFADTLSYLHSTCNKYLGTINSLPTLNSLGIINFPPLNFKPANSISVAITIPKLVATVALSYRSLNHHFQQIKNMPKEVTRTDDAPLKYKKDETLGRYKPMLDPKKGKERHWNVKRSLRPTRGIELAPRLRYPRRGQHVIQ